MPDCGLTVWSIDETIAYDQIHEKWIILNTRMNIRSLFHLDYLWYCFILSTEGLSLIDKGQSINELLHQGTNVLVHFLLI